MDRKNISESLTGIFELKIGGWTYYLGGGFKYFLFSTLPGEMIQFDQFD